MHEQLSHHLAAAPDLYPRRLEERYPRIVARIASAWDSPEEAEAVFDELLIDRRGNRQGFPVEVAREILRLRLAYDGLKGERKAESDVWGDERRRAATTLEDLGLRRVPADMLGAAERGDVGRLRLFIEAGMDVDSRDARDWTPLMVAAFQGHEAAARFLIQHGANPRARDSRGYTPLHWAAFKGYSDVSALIARRVDCNVQSSAGITPLLQASANGHAEVVRLLLDAGAEPDIGTRDGWTPLHKAVANGHTAVVRLLLGSGASPFSRHADGTTPHALARRGGNMEILRLLRQAIGRRRARSGQSDELRSR